MRQGGRPEQVAAVAFAPGHITVLFSPETRARDPRARGSVGAGIVLREGVRAQATWTPGARRSIVLRSTPRRPLPISREAARRLVGPRKGRLEVELVHDLPIGQGFGMSAAGALATGLATARVLGRGRQEAVEIAHLAALFGGGGLGGVSAILGGGLEVRRTPGIPPWGEVRHAAWRRPVYFGVVGSPLPSPRLLSDPGFLRRVRDAARAELGSLTGRLREDRLLEAGRRFSDRLDLGSPKVRRYLTRLRSEGFLAGQTMFGQVLYAVPRDVAEETRLQRSLREMGLGPRRVAPGRRGAYARPAPGPGTAAPRRADGGRVRLLNRRPSRAAP